MNLQQLEYIIAVDEDRHFVRAAEKCFVTQATLSMMVKKLEEELGCMVFDRSKQPVVPTEIGHRLIAQARVIICEQRKMFDMVTDSQAAIAGEVKVGIIPTIAPYLLPLFLPSFLNKFPQVHITIREITTQQIVDQLQKGTIDMGILATPLSVEGLKEEVLYYEKFKVFTAPQQSDSLKNYILPEEIDTHKLLLLEEGHCMRTQMLNICELQKNRSLDTSLDYEAGSIESLINLAEAYEGITIIPELCLQQLSATKRSQVKSFVVPEPVREVSLVTYRHFAKKRIHEALSGEIKAGVETVLEPQAPQNVIGIQ